MCFQTVFAAEAADSVWKLDYLKYCQRLEEDIAGRGLPEQAIFLPYALAGSKLEGDRAGLWSLSALDAVRFSPSADSLGDVRLDPRASAKIALGRLEELYSFFGGDWPRTVLAYAVSAPVAASEPDSCLGSSVYIQALEKAQRLYQDRPQESFELLEELMQARRKEAERERLAQARLLEERAKAAAKAAYQAKARQSRIVYRIKPGDYLGKIARKYGVRVSDLKKWNRLRSDFIREGRTLVIYRK